jgi:hypothetical protein
MLWTCEDRKAQRRMKHSVCKGGTAADRPQIPKISRIAVEWKIASSFLFSEREQAAGAHE